MLFRVIVTPTAHRLEVLSEVTNSWTHVKDLPDGWQIPPEAKIFGTDIILYNDEENVYFAL